MTSENTQLTSAINYDVSRMIFSEAQIGTIPDSKPQISYMRININTRNENGTAGDLIFPTEKCFSFGVSENTNPDTGKINGYVMPICLFSRDGATEIERSWVNTFDAVVEKCKDHLISHREEINQYELERNDLKKLNPLYYKRDKGKIVEGTGPTLYAKLIMSKKQEKLVSMFFDFNGENINGMDLIGKYLHTRAAIKIESIFIGNKISLQVKLYECEVKLAEQGPKRLLARPVADTRVLTRPVHQSGPPIGQDSDDEGSIGGNEDKQKGVEESKEESKEDIIPAKRVVRRVVTAKK